MTKALCGIIEVEFPVLVWWVSSVPWLRKAIALVYILQLNLAVLKNKVQKEPFWMLQEYWLIAKSHNRDAGFHGHPPSKAWCNTSSIRFASNIWKPQKVRLLNTMYLCQYNNSDVNFFHKDVMKNNIINTWASQEQSPPCWLRWQQGPLVDLYGYAPAVLPSLFHIDAQLISVQALLFRT